MHAHPWVWFPLALFAAVPAFAQEATPATPGAPAPATPGAPATPAIPGAPASTTPGAPAATATPGAPATPGQAAQPAAVCPPCNCDCRCPEVEIPIPASQDPARQVTGAAQVTVGTGGGPQPLVRGPLVITTLSSDCPLLFLVRGPDGTAAPVVSSFNHLWLPEESTLEIGEGIGLCTGRVLFSGYRP